MDKKLVDMFWKNVKKTNNCWEWIGKKIVSDGYKYGYFNYRKEVYKAHRLSWELHYGEIPKGFVVFRKCRNFFCCTPSHLSLGKKSKMSTYLSQQKGALCVRKLTENQVRQIREMYAPWSRKTGANVLGKMFNVSNHTILNVVSRRQYKNVV